MNFGIGQQSDADTDQIRGALVATLSDIDAEVGHDGIIGLGRRRDRRAVRYLKLLLRDDAGDIFAREAAAKLLRLSESGQITIVHRVAVYDGRRIDRVLN